MAALKRLVGSSRDLSRFSAYLWDRSDPSVRAMFPSSLSLRTAIASNWRRNRPARVIDVFAVGEGSGWADDIAKRCGDQVRSGLVMVHSVIKWLHGPRMMYDVVFARRPGASPEFLAVDDEGRLSDPKPRSVVRGPLVACRPGQLHLSGRLGGSGAMGTMYGGPKVVNHGKPCIGGPFVFDVQWRYANGGLVPASGPPHLRYRWPRRVVPSSVAMGLAWSDHTGDVSHSACALRNDPAFLYFRALGQTRRVWFPVSSCLALGKRGAVFLGAIERGNFATVDR